MRSGSGAVGGGLLLGIDGRHRVLRLAALHVQPIGVGGLEPVAFDLVAAGEGLHLTAVGLLIAEVDRAQRALTADGTGSRFGIAHTPTVHRVPTIRSGTPHEVDDRQDDEDNHEDADDPEPTDRRKHAFLHPTPKSRPPAFGPGFRILVAFRPAPV